MPTPELIALARRLVADGVLPTTLPTATLGGPSDGAPCAVCSQPIEPGRVEIELEWGRDGPRLVMHPTCHAAWLLAVRPIVTN